MLVYTSYDDHQEYIWSNGRHLNHFNIILKLYNDRVEGGEIYTVNAFMN